MNYKLYLLLPDRIPKEERFFLVTAQYCLLYTNGEKPEGAIEIRNVKKLPHLAKEWLGRCIDELRAEALKKQKDRLLEETGPAFIGAFAEALKTEREKISQGGETEDA